MKIRDFIHIEPVKPVSGRHSSSYQAVFLDTDGSELLTGEGSTREAAEADLLDGLRTSLRDDSAPCVLIFRKETVVIWRQKRFWAYGFLRDAPTPSSVTVGDWDRCEVERQARRHLAKNQWNEIEETSTIITCEADQQEFTAWVQREKACRRLCAHGWQHEEAQHILSGLVHLLAPSHIEELGDPLAFLTASTSTNNANSPEGETKTAPLAFQ